MNAPLYLIPWQEDFFAGLYGLVRDLDSNPGSCLVVFPNQRPRRYLQDYFKRHAAKPVLLPVMLTKAQLKARWLANWSPKQATLEQASRLDRVALLARAIEQSPELRLDHLDLLSFFPWGMRLADVLEAMFENLVQPVDIAHAGDLVEPFAAQLLAGLGTLGRAYRTALELEQLTTPGLNTARLADLSATNLPLPAFLAEKKVILAGFDQLSHADEQLYRRLWSEGATVCLHSDPGLLDGKGHWSSQDLAQMAKRWKTGFNLLGANRPRKQSRHFFAAYDLHSQLTELHELLEQDQTNPAPDSRAIVLPGSETLLPLLHSLPDKEVNIALGYPLQRTLLARFVEQILQLRESALADGRVHWRTLLHLIRHPYLRMLKASPAADQRPKSLRPFFQLMEQKIRTGPRHPLPEAIVEQTLHQALSGASSHPFFQQSPQDLLFYAGIIEEWYELTLAAWHNAHTLEAAAQALRACFQFLLKYGGEAWQAFPLDAEAMFRVLSQVLPQLSFSRLSAEPLDQATLFTIIRQMLADLRVAFEADPLQGLQILGLQETSLLRFNQVVILDLTEDKWPGPPVQDPLLPDNLRVLLGLPSNRSRDRALAHAFYRLTAGADSLHLFWQEGQDKSGLLEAKKTPSRLVQDLIWQQEKAEGRLLSQGQPPLRSAAFPSAPPRLPQARAVLRSPEIQARLLGLLQKPITPTWLDTYLKCPLLFYQQNLCDIRKLEEVREGDDPPGLGSVLHTALHQAFTPFLGRQVQQGDLRLEKVLELFWQEFNASDLPGRLPPHSLFLLQHSVPLRLGAFLAQQPEQFKLLHLEENFRTSLQVEQHNLELLGKVDRVDQRAQGLVILDYKSGRVTNFNVKVWQDQDLWTRMAAWHPNATDNPLPDLARELSSLQLPLYLHVFNRQTHQTPFDAAWVELAGGGLEKSCLGEKPTLPERLERIQEKIPAMLDFVLRHLLHSSAFLPQPGKHCQYCAYKGLCPPLSARLQAAEPDSADADEA